MIQKLLFPDAIATPPGAGPHNRPALERRRRRIHRQQLPPPDAASGSRPLTLGEAAVLLISGKVGVSRSFEVVLDVAGGRLVLRPGTTDAAAAFRHASRIRRDLVQAVAAVLARPGGAD